MGCLPPPPPPGPRQATCEREEEGGAGGGRVVPPLPCRGALVPLGPVGGGAGPGTGGGSPELPGTRTRRRRPAGARGGPGMVRHVSVGRNGTYPSRKRGWTAPGPPRAPAGQRWRNCAPGDCGDSGSVWGGGRRARAPVTPANGRTVSMASRAWSRTSMEILSGRRSFQTGAGPRPARHAHWLASAGETRLPVIPGILFWDVPHRRRPQASGLLL
eukprot:gene17620-biopygen9884